MIIFPSLEQISELVRKDEGNLIPICMEMSADLLTPVSAYLKLRSLSDTIAAALPTSNSATNNEYSFLFESVAGGEKIGRYSIMGAFPESVVRFAAPSSSSFPPNTTSNKTSNTTDNMTTSSMSDSTNVSTFPPGDPLILVEERLKSVRVVKVPGIHSFTGKSIPSYYEIFFLCSLWECRILSSFSFPFGQKKDPQSSKLFRFDTQKFQKI
jgi:anthranilate synthase component I